MVCYCVVPTCRNGQDNTKGISFHTFPFKRPEILKLWIQAIGRENWNPAKTSRLCGSHFLPTDYVNKPDSLIRQLKPNSVPSVFSPPGQPIPEFATPHTEIQEPRKDEEETATDRVHDDIEPVNMNVDSPITCTPAAVVKKYVDKGTQITFSGKKFYILRRKVKTLKQKVKRRDEKIALLKDWIKEISDFKKIVKRKRVLGNDNLVAKLKKHFEGVPLEFIIES